MIRASAGKEVGNGVLTGTNAQPSEQTDILVIALLLQMLY